MRAASFSHYGQASNLTVIETETPKPKPDEILIKIIATAINDWDWGIVRGKPFYMRLLIGLFKPKIQIPGVDISGIVIECGDLVEDFKPGDEVYGDISDHGFGGFAEYVALNPKAVVKKPKSMSHQDAAALPHAAMLAYQALVDIGQVNSQKTVLFNGAGGGVGTIGIQIAKALGVSSISGVDSGEKRQMLTEMGFHHVVDYQTTDFTKEPHQYDLIIDAKTNRSVFHYLRALKKNGMYVTVGGKTFRLLQTVILSPFIRQLFKKHIRVLALKPNKDLLELNALYETGKINPQIDGPYPLHDIAKALQRFGDGRHQGKVIITIHDENNAD